MKMKLLGFVACLVVPFAAAQEASPDTYTPPDVIPERMDEASSLNLKLE